MEPELELELDLELALEFDLGLNLVSDMDLDLDLESLPDLDFISDSLLLLLLIWSSTTCGNLGDLMGCICKGLLFIGRFLIGVPPIADSFTGAETSSSLVSLRL